MCGIAGVVGRQPDLAAIATAMGDALHHRGPDGSGVEEVEPGLVAFAHRRLAIVDLSPQGHQPMTSADGRWTISFNGEIYNHQALRRELDEAGRTPPTGWRGHSDTETLVEAVAAWGIERAVERSVGMFAIALYDRAERRLTLLRDRFGEKPLYYGWCGPDFVFASELKAIRRHPDFDPAIEPRALPGYVATGVVGGSWSIHRRLFTLLPGTRLDLELAGGKPPAPLDRPLAPGQRAEGIRIGRYWDYRDVVSDGLAAPITDEAEATAALDAALRESIRGQAMADVPVGAFLSGGVDSSSVVALYQAVSNRNVRTYTIGFDDPAFDESSHARAVAEHLGTDHTNFEVSLREAQDVIPLLPAIYDEPFADSSQIPTFLVSKLARQEVAVALTGDGGDELLGGYNRHVLAPALWSRIGAVPRPLRKALFGAGALLPNGVLETAGALAGLTAKRSNGDKIRKFARTAAAASSFGDVAESFLDEWHGERSPLRSPLADENRARPLSAGASPLVHLTYRDALDYLPDDILVKVDRASMSVSLETRVPFLDHRVAAVAAKISPGLKVRGGRGKYILRQLLARHVPPAIIDRPKAGFAIPVGDWLKGPLRDWAEDLLDPSAMRNEGLFDEQVVQRRWRSHLTGQRDSTPAIWAILMFESWRRSQRESM